MVTLNTRVPTTSGSLVRGFESSIAVHPSDALLKKFLARLGSKADPQAVRARFEFRLASRGGRLFLQMQSRAGFGTLKSFQRPSEGDRRAAQRTGASETLKPLIPTAPTVQRIVHQGVKPAEVAKSPRPPRHCLRCLISRPKH